MQNKFTLNQRSLLMCNWNIFVLIRFIIEKNQF